MLMLLLLGGKSLGTRLRIRNAAGLSLIDFLSWTAAGWSLSPPCPFCIVIVITRYIVMYHDLCFQTVYLLCKNLAVYNAF